MNVNSVSSPAFQSTQNTNGTTNSIDSKKDIKEVIKDNKGKIALGLSALAAVGIAAVAISRGKKAPSELSIDDFKKIGKFDKGFATVKGKPYSGVINATNKEGKYALEYADGALKSSTKVDGGEFKGYKFGLQPFSKKVYTEKDGVRTVENFYRDYSQKAAEVWIPTGRKTIISDGKVTKEHMSLTGDILRDVVEKQQDGTWKKTFQEMEFFPDETFKNKNFFRRYILTKDEAGNVIAKKPVYARKPSFSSGETFIKRVEKYADKDGNQVVETLKNGKPFARQTTKIADDGSRQIVVEYLDKGSKGYKKIIDIAKDGTRRESEIGSRLFSL